MYSLFSAGIEDKKGVGGKFECYECEKSFKTAALLQKHLDGHDSLTGVANESSGVSNASKGKDSNTAKNSDRTYKPSAKIESLAVGAAKNNVEDGFQSWKKRKRNMYLNK